MKKEVTMRPVSFVRDEVLGGDATTRTVQRFESFSCPQREMIGDDGPMPTCADFGWDDDSVGGDEAFVMTGEACRWFRGMNVWRGQVCVACVYK